MAWSYIAGATQHGRTASADITSPAMDTTGADYLQAILLHNNQFGGTISISDSKGNSWVAITEYNNGSSYIHVFRCLPTSVGSSHTVTFSTSSSFPTFGVVMLVDAVSGANQTTPVTDFAAVNDAWGAGVTTTQPGEVTPDTGGLCLAQLVGTDNSDPTWAINESYTERQDSRDDGIGTTAASASKETGSANNPTWTVTASGNVFLGGGNVNVAVAAAGGGGRTTKNTRAFPLGVEIGMNWQQCNI